MEKKFKGITLRFTRLNPLEVKKQLDSLRHRKTDKIDAESLAQTQFVLNRNSSYIQDDSYEQLRDLSRFYQTLTEDIVRNKNRLHMVLQVTFPELERALASTRGEQYWNFANLFPHPLFVLSLPREELEEAMRQSTAKRFSEKQFITLADKLTQLAKDSYPAVDGNSPIVEQVQYYAQELLRLSQIRDGTLDTMSEKSKALPEYEILMSIPGIAETTATSIIGELGDVRRFRTCGTFPY